MRYIKSNEVKAAIEKHDPNWFDKAEKALEDVKALVNGGADKKTISDAIKNRSSIWRELKGVLEKISNKKCWYCESRDDRSDNSVDHYRPKNRVAECGDEHPGYWWLAFAWDNYRYACTYCNSRRNDREGETAGGKHDHFPVWDEAKRASDCNNSLETDNEQPLLLDPLRQSDPTFLWFDEDGQAVPNPIMTGGEGSYPHDKATASIRLYHLNHAGIVERRLELFREITEDLKSADEFFLKLQRGDMTAQTAYEDKLTSLRKRVRSDSVNSAAATAMLAGLRTRYPAAEAIFQQGSG